MAGSALTFPRGREVVLGIGAGIAAYKSCELLRRLQDHGFLVTVIPTPSSLNFVGKTTWEALSSRPVRTEVWESADSVSHVALGEKADLILLAPATADLIAKIASGRADDLLTTTVLASQALKIIVPAMHPAMWLNPATIANVALLRDRGMIVVEPDYGRLTGKDSGVGRFPDTPRIIDEVLRATSSTGSLLGKKVLVTTGGTREAIDPVRYIGNRSSGRQGLAIAYQALREGADVTVVTAETVDFELEGATIIRALSAEAMLEELKERLPESDALVMAAAVSDARPSAVASEKIKKNELKEISLQPNPDLLATVAKTRRPNQVLVGFAAETDADFLALGNAKREAKGVDLLYVTDVSQGRVFGEERTRGALLDKSGVLRKYEDEDKFLVAKELVDVMAKKLGERRG